MLYEKMECPQNFTDHRIEMALSGSHCGLARVYSSSNMIRLPCNKYVYQGSLSIGGVLQAQACGSKKKEAKLKTYDAALERFLTLELPDILKGVEPQVRIPSLACFYNY